MMGRNKTIGKLPYGHSSWWAFFRIPHFTVFLIESNTSIHPDKVSSYILNDPILGLTTNIKNWLFTEITPKYLLDYQFQYHDTL